MIEITNAEASANILRFAAEGRLTQKQWHDRDADGREIACILGAIHPSVGKPADCNGNLMPMWLAELTPALFDGLPAGDVYPLARRYGELVARWHTLTPAQWDAILTRVLIRCIDDAVAAARPVCEGKPYWPQVEAACTQCQAAIKSGDKVAAEAAWAAAEAAWAAAEAAWAAAEAARAAARAARAAAEAAAGATRVAAEAAAAVSWRSYPATSTTAVLAARAAAHLTAAYRSLFTFVLDEIEAALREAR